MSDPIDFYFDFLSPFGYLAAMKIDDLAARHNRTANWHPFLLGITVVTYVLLVRAFRSLLLPLKAVTDAGLKATTGLVSLRP